MSKAVVCTGAEPTRDDGIHFKGEWQDDEDVTDVIVADWVTEIKRQAFQGCKGLTNLSFLKDSAVTTVGYGAFWNSRVTSLHGVEGVRKIGFAAFTHCKDLRTIEGLGCEEMGDCCFAYCTLLKSMKGWPASMTVIPVGCFWNCTGMATVGCDLSHVTSIEVHPEHGHAFAGCTSLLPPSLSAPGSDPAAVLAFLKEMASNEREAARNAALAAEQDAERAEQAEQDAERAARAAEDSLLAELDAEDAAKKAGKKKKKKKKKASGKQGKAGQGEEADDWRTAFQRYEQSDMMRGVDERKRQRNLKEAARIMAAHEQKIAARSLPPSLDPPPAAPPAAPNALEETTEDIEAQIAALGLDLAPLPAPDELAETAEDIDAQIAALGPPPDFPPAPPPAAAPDAFLESLLAAPPPPAPPQSLKETVAELHVSVFGADPPPGASLLAVVEKLEAEFGYVGTGTVGERINNVRLQF
ncbi:hypothetical protein TeGR_g14722 [Tetraparma gracilis]|uniref:Uncharacterized protein n=1 Tax=Tetraparma gracilis TaxID=2962635 RepID=A0ABQ6M8L3_9STRA|nr:hypothetical protein TeGR_g14722 [Tetraparma gracilis]